jgi:MYXO-CTERM domain-containing protein
MSPEATVSAIVLDPTDPQVVYVADLQSGVFGSTDGGAKWLRIEKGMRMRHVNALAISGDGQHLYAATEGEGVFRLDLNGEPPSSQPTLDAGPATSDAGAAGDGGPGTDGSGISGDPAEGCGCSNGSGTRSVPLVLMLLGLPLLRNRRHSRKTWTSG